MDLPGIMLLKAFSGMIFVAIFSIKCMSLFLLLLFLSYFLVVFTENVVFLYQRIVVVSDYRLNIYFAVFLVAVYLPDSLFAYFFAYLLSFLIYIVINWSFISTVQCEVFALRPQGRGILFFGRKGGGLKIGYFSVNHL